MVLLNLGNMLEFLGSTPQVSVPNSPIEAKTFIDQSLIKFQTSLDHAELEIVFAERYLQYLLDVRRGRLTAQVIKIEEHPNLKQDDSAVVKLGSSSVDEIKYVSDWLDDGYVNVNKSSSIPREHGSFSAGGNPGTGDESLYNNHFNPAHHQ